MILAAHQPCYLPDRVFFLKMALADVFVLTDDFQYTTHSLINRSRIKTAQGVGWLTVPVLTKGHRRQPIGQVLIEASQNWSRKHWRTLAVNYSYAPYFEQFADFLEELYLKKRWRRLLDLNQVLIEFARKTLKLSTMMVLSSTLDLPSKGNSSLIEMAEAFGCDTFLAEPIFKDYLNTEVFAEHNITLKMIKFQEKEYHQQFGSFIPGLSIIDLLFNEGNESGNFILGESSK